MVNSTLCYVMLCYAILCCVILCYVILYYIILYYIILYYIILYYIMYTVCLLHVSATILAVLGVVNYREYITKLFEPVHK